MNRYGDAIPPSEGEARARRPDALVAELQQRVALAPYLEQQQPSLDPGVLSQRELWEGLRGGGQAQGAAPPRPTARSSEDSPTDSHVQHNVGG